MPLQTQIDTVSTLADIIDRILDKGLVINADIIVKLVGVELLDIRIRAAIASFETAARYGLEFPSGTKLPQWAGQAIPAALGNGNGSGHKEELAQVMGWPRGDHS